MQRMVKQFGTAQDSPDLKSQLYNIWMYLPWIAFLNLLLFSHQIRTYTQQLVKDTDTLIKELVSSNDRHLKIQRDRLVDEFTTALNAFQVSNVDNAYIKIYVFFRFKFQFKIHVYTHRSCLQASK